MKRRKFIQAALVLPALPLGSVAAADRLYGTPGSLLKGGGTVGAKFRLPLARAGLPEPSWNNLAAVSQVIENVLTEEKEADAFFRSPARYFTRHGLDASDRTLVDSSVAMLTALSHPAVRESLEAGDYAATFDYLKVAGLFEPRDPSVFRNQIESLMRANIDEIRKSISAGPGRLAPSQEKLLLSVLQDAGVAASEDDLAIISQMVATGDNTTMGCTALALCLVGVGIAAIAVLYVSVVVAATVILAVGAGISVAVAVAVTVVGSPENQLLGESASFNGSFAKFDPALMRNTERAVRLGAITGDAGIQVHAIRSLLREEVSAFMHAMRSTDILSIEGDQMDFVIEATTAYACKALGLSAR